eukprot:3546853-Rhodomonas_salina.1
MAAGDVRGEGQGLPSRTRPPSPSSRHGGVWSDQVQVAGSPDEQSKRQSSSLAPSLVEPPNTRTASTCALSAHSTATWSVRALGAAVEPARA